MAFCCTERSNRSQNLAHVNFADYIENICKSSLSRSIGPKVSPIKSSRIWRNFAIGLGPRGFMRPYYQRTGFQCAEKHAFPNGRTGAKLKSNANNAAGTNYSEGCR